MSDYIEVTADYRTVHLAAHPVSLTEFLAFLDETERPRSPELKKAPANSPGAPEPVIGVTQPDAAAYCEWVGRKTRRPCRLPSTNELDALMPHTSATHSHGVVPDAGFWPHAEGHLPELRGGLKPVFLCEWTRDIEEAASTVQPDRVLALIFYPPWLREGDNPLHIHAAVLSSKGYSFVTFRVSYEG